MLSHTQYHHHLPLRQLRSGTVGLSKKGYIAFSVFRTALLIAILI